MKRVTFRGRLAGSAAALVLASSAPSLAQASATPAAGADAQPAGLADIVVTARRVGESAQRTPIAITTLSTEALRDKVIQGALDLQRETPSLDIRQSAVAPSGLQFSMRGQTQIDVAASTSSSVGIYLDDVYLGSGPLAGGILSVHDLERVEVLKGPQGTLYGRNVTGGVVKFVTKKPTDQAEAYFTGGLGNYDRHYLEGMVNLPLSEKLAIRLLGTIDNHDGYSHDIRSDRDLENQHLWNLRGAVKLDATERFSVLAQGWYGRYRSNGVDPRTIFLTPGLTPAALNLAVEEKVNGLTAQALAPIFFGTAAGFTQDQINAALGAGIAALPKVQALLAQFRDAPRSEARGNPRLPSGVHGKQGGGALTLAYDLGDATLKSITGYDYGSRDGYFNVGGGPSVPIASNQTGQVKQLTQEFQVTGTALDARLKYAAGVYFLDARYQDNRLDASGFGAFPFLLGQFGLGVTNGTASINKLRTKAEAVYGQATYEILPDLNLTAGLRYTNERSRVRSNTFDRPSLANMLTTTCSGPSPLTAATPLGQCFASGSTKSDNVSYTAGLDYSFSRDILVYAKTSRGFKAGGVNAFTTQFTPILPYKPETNTDYELGLKSQFLDRRVRLNMSYYHTIYKNIQRIVPKQVAPNVQSTAVQNAASAKIDGVEAELTVAPARGLTFTATGAYTDGRYIDYLAINNNYPGNIVDLSDSKFQGLSRYTYSVSGGYDFSVGWSDIRAELVWSHRSKANLFEGDQIPSKPGLDDFAPLAVTSQRGFGLLNGSVTFDVPKIRSLVTFYGKNILDKRYKQSVFSLNNVGAGFTFATYGPPATYGVDWTVKF